MRNLVKASTVAALFMVSISVPAFADGTPSGVASDVGAVQKDNSALSKDNSDLAKDRASKANNKATGNWVGQASDSVSVGADKVTKSEKETEKSTDKKILNNDVDSATSK